MAGFGSLAPSYDLLTGLPIGAPDPVLPLPPKSVASRFGSLSPFADVASMPVSNPIATGLYGMGKSLATLPQRAIEASAQDVQHLGEGDYYRASVEPATEAALLMMGGAPLVGGVSKAGETALGIVPVDIARKLNVKSSLPEGDLFRRAVENTHGASMDAEAVTLPVTRRQRPEQEMSESVRGGVFYLPQGSKDAKFYTGTKENFAYGGHQQIDGETAFKNPLFVKGATGGKAPEAAFDQLQGKGAYQDMRTDALRSTGGYYLGRSDKSELVRQFLEKHAPEMEHMADHILTNSTKGNQLAYALQEAAVASAARRAGHDGVIGYSTKRNPTKDPFISEVYDVRENRYPSPEGDYSIWDGYKHGGQ